MSEQLKFKISSALKDIIGRDLITDDFIAVFELVKNSFDAHATRVEIIFENIETGNGRLIIKDNGKGMNYNDLIDKWLFVAYSAKKEGTEDRDYRDNIYADKPFAGAKGIGRFSCDRLGKRLQLETTKDEKNSNTEVLITDWEKFEENLKDEFINVSVFHDRKNKNDFDLEHGTILIINDLRSEWDRGKYLRLKDSLAKLINPVVSEDKNEFEICISVEEELDSDEKETEDRRKVNGEVKNFIFEDLGLKTTKIITKFSPDRKLITTELRDGDILIYKITETNNFKLLGNINFTLYYLNQSAKLTFARRMGLAARLYGHVFLYKNGFRIFPFGEPGEDPLKVDERKSRKQYSLLGTSELMGQIDIYGENPELRETSSRGDGLINTPTFAQLKEAFNFILARLEKYVVDVQEWGLSLDEDLDEYDGFKLKVRIGQLIEQLTGSQSIIDFDYGDNFFEILKDAQESSALAVIENLKKIAATSDDDKLILETKNIEHQFEKLRHFKDEAEIEARLLGEELKEKDSENLFLKSIKSQDFEDIVNLMHQIGISTSTIQHYIKGVVYRADAGEIFDGQKLKDVLGKINMEVNKIYSISRFATKANFKIGTRETKIDLQDFINEYLKNIVRPFLPSKLDFSVRIDTTKPFIMEVKPIEITIILDNLINNSKKAKARRISISLITESRDSLVLKFRDDGAGIPIDIQDKIFNYGFTTTEGSGLGLTHIKNIIENMGGSIKLNTDYKNGAEFILIFNRF